MTIKITYTGANQYRIRNKGPKSVTLYAPWQLSLMILADKLGTIVTEWEDLGRVLAFFTASDAERDEAAKALGIKFEPNDF